jgi:hypothetical protein
MILNQKTLEQLRILINETTENRSGAKLVKFFNDLGFHDTYGQGFPSRWIYTDEKLAKINGTPELDECIKRIFNPINFIGRVNELDKLINDFNQYLAFDHWKVKRSNEIIAFEKTDGKIIIPENKDESNNEKDFLQAIFENESLEGLKLDSFVKDVLTSRIEEVQKCIKSESSLSVIFLCGSILEGLLLGIALQNMKQFNQAKAAPLDKTGKVKAFQEWSLSNLIDVSFEIGLIQNDVKKYSHSLREFRNYIHPFQQVSENFNPDIHTAKISWQVLKATIFQLKKSS